MNIKTVGFFNREYDGPKHKVFLISCVGSLAFSLILVIANRAAQVVSHENLWSKLGLLSLFLAVCTVSIVCKRRALNHTTIVAQQVIRKVRLQFIDKLRHTELQFLEQREKGEIYARIVQDTELLSRALPNLVGSFESALSAVAILAYIAWISLTGFVLTLSTMVIMNAIFIRRYVKIKEALRVARLKEGEFNDALNSVLSGFKEIRINTRKNNDLFLDIEVLSRKSEQLKTGAEVDHDKNVVLAVLLSQVVLGVIVFIVPQYSAAYGDVVSQLVASVLFLFGLTGMAMGGIYTITRANVAVENLERLKADIDSFGTIAETEIGDSLTEFREIALRSVTFQYPDRDGEKGFTVGPLDFTVEQGEVLFIVGGNGSGKSTLLKLLTGLYYPAPGRPITCDGRPLSRTTYQAYRELFSVIFTDFHLFKRLYGLESVDEEEVQRLLETMELGTKTACVDGRFTKIDLSTGQKKRLAYITSILRDKPIYVFDEWAADQDPTFRTRFYNEFLDDLRAMGKTVIAVTHDDRFFDRADRVIEMEEGRVVADRRRQPKGGAEPL